MTLTLNETLSVSVALLSLVVATISLVRTRKLAEEQLTLERITAELSTRQIALIDAEESQRQRPDFLVELLGNSGDHYFLISNRGDGSAIDVQFELVDCPNSPIYEDFVRMFPVKEFKAGTVQRVDAAINSGSPLSYVAKLQWRERDNSLKSEEFHLHL